MLILYHDVTSAASLVAVLRLQQLADEGYAVAFRGFDLLGLDVAIPATLDDLEDWERHRAEAAALGWDLARPRLHPPTLTCHLLGILADESGRGAAWREAAYAAHWRESRDVGDPAVLAELAAAVGLAADEVAALLDDPGRRHRLRRQMLVHRGDGVGGVPVLDANGTFVTPFLDDDDLRALASL